MRLLFARIWLLCGALDALYATVMTMARGADIAAMWRGVAVGPFGEGARDWGLAGSLAGLGVHFAIMAAMVAVGMGLARGTRLGQVAPWKAGTLYGVAPQRFGVPFPNPDRIKLALGLLPHIVLVGIPIFALIRRTPQPS